VLTAFPDHCLLGEESEPTCGAGVSPAGTVGAGVSPAQAAGTAAPQSQYRWIVDPLDGTTNYVHGVPHYCVSLALERNGRLLVGAVYDPTLDECFTAIEGRGARLNGKPIHASGVSTLSESLAAIGFPPTVQPDAPDLRLFLELLPRCQAIRRTGSTALNLCYVAAGRFDLYGGIRRGYGRGGGRIDRARGRRPGHLARRRRVLARRGPFSGGGHAGTARPTPGNRRAAGRMRKMCREPFRQDKERMK